MGATDAVGEESGTPRTPGDPLSVVVVATQLGAPVPGGTGRYAAALVRSLEATRPARGELTAYMAGQVAPGAGLELPAAVRTHRSRLDFRVLARLWERDLPPRAPAADVVHAATLMVPPVRPGTALVVTVHDVVPWTHPETLTPHGVAFHRTMAERAARRAALLLAPTQAVADRLVDVLAPACPVRVAAPPVAPLVAPPDAVRRRSALGAPDAYLLFVGTAEPRKGLDVLVRALAADRALPPLLVVGPDGWGDVGVVDLARAAGVGDRVRVLGRVDEADLAALYAAAAAVAVPSRAEGFGLPVLEALGLGAPVVTSDDPALVEVGGGVTAVVPVGDAAALAAALRSVVDETGDARRSAGLTRAAEFSPERLGRRLWSDYAELSSAGRATRSGKPQSWGR